MRNRIALNNLENGDINAMFDAAVVDVLSNINDGSTDVSKKRTIVVEVSLVPYKGNRDVLVSQVKVKTKLASIISTGQILTVGNDDGELCLFDEMKDQGTLPGSAA